MPYENCDQCQKCNACPVTSGDIREGAHPITQDTGDVWYCTNCFYCEDICPDYSPRKYALDKRRHKECSSTRMQDPIKQLKAYGTLFPTTSTINSIRNDFQLPKLPKPKIKELKILYKAILNPTKIIQKHEIKRKNNYNSKIKSKKDQNIALFLGCLIPYRVYEYEQTARILLHSLEINYHDLPFSCCGSIMTESYSEDLWLVIAGYNLAIAEEKGIKKIITLCGGCAGNLRRVNQLLQKNKDSLRKVNSYLGLIGKRYNGTIIVEHLTEFLLNEEQKSKIRKLFDKNRLKALQNLLISVQIPCQIIRPKDSSPYSDQESKLLKELLKPTGIKIMDYPFETLCCGSSMLQYDVPLAHKIAKKRIDFLKKSSVDALILACGNCSMNYSVHQSDYNKDLIPIFFFTEIIVYALGYPHHGLSTLINEKE